MSVMLLGAMPVVLFAQDDDMYFVPTKANQAKEAYDYGLPSRTYYSGSNRSVDDYNRRVRSSATPIDSTGNDIIDFSAVRGVYPDSTYVDTPGGDYTLTRHMSRFDGYSSAEAYRKGYLDGQWSSPWYVSSYYGWYDWDPWYWDRPWHWGYYGWPSSWYYSGYWGYHRPWYYGGWGPRYYVGRSYRVNSGRPVNHRPSNPGGRNFGGYRNSSTRVGTYSGSSFGGSRGSSFGGSRGSSSGGSFGGSRGGGFGGGRSTSGGRNFGGHR